MKQVIVQPDAICVRGEMTRKEVVALRQELLAAFCIGEAPKVVRLGEVTSLDSAGIQLLCALLKGFPGLCITDVPENVAVVCQKMGAKALLGGL